MGDSSGYSVSLWGGAVIFSAPFLGEGNHGSEYIVDNNFYLYLKRVYAQIRLGGGGVLLVPFLPLFLLGSDSLLSSPRI